MSVTSHMPLYATNSVVFMGEGISGFDPPDDQRDKVNTPLESSKKGSNFPPPKKNWHNFPLNPPPPPQLWPPRKKLYGPHWLWTCNSQRYTAKLLLYQSPSRHSDYTATEQWQCSVNCQQHSDYTVYQLCSHHAAGSCQQWLHHHCPVTV